MITQLDIGSSQKVNSSKNLIGAHQTRTRADTAAKNHKTALFDNLDLRKYYVAVDGQRYPWDSSLLNYEENVYIEQYKDLKLFFKECIGEELMTSFISSLDMKTKYPFKIIVSRHQPEHITPKKFNYFHEYADPENGWIFRY